MFDDRHDAPHFKPHPKDRPIEPEDPMNLHAVELHGDPDVMLRMMVEEYARLGCDLESFIELSRQPFYQGLHGLWLLYGEQELRRRAAEVLCRTGVMRVRSRQARPTEPHSDLVQITLPHGSKGGSSDA